MPRRIPWSVALIALAGAASGCSSDAHRGVVKGRVTFKGQPVTGALIHFENREGGVEAQAALDADGRYEVKTLQGDGLPAGRYKVAVAPGRIMQPGEEAPLAGKAPPKGSLPPTTAVPAKYLRTATSDLVAEVKAGDNPAFDFELKP